MIGPQNRCPRLSWVFFFPQRPHLLCEKKSRDNLGRTGTGISERTTVEDVSGADVAQADKGELYGFGGENSLAALTYSNNLIRNGRYSGPVNRHFRGCFPR